MKTLALADVNTLESKVDELTSMIGALCTLVEYCQGDQRPESPIPEGLSNTPTPAISTAKSILLKR